MLKDGESFTAADVADAMILVKVARNIANQKRDNWADIAGYAGCGYESTLESAEAEIALNVYVSEHVSPEAVKDAIEKFSAHENLRASR